MRQAIWEAHDKRCAYCGDPLSYKDLALDHIIPQAEDLNRASAMFGLGAEFDFDGPENLLPTCARCNRQKSDRMSNLTIVSHFIELAQGRRKEVLTIYRRVTKQDHGEAVRALVLGSLESGTLTEEIIKELIKEASPRLEFLVSQHFSLWPKISAQGLTREDVAPLLTRMVRVGGTDDVGVELANDDGERVIVSSLAEYREATDKGFFPLTTLAIKFATRYFEIPLAIIKAIEVATPADKSYLEDVSLAELHLLSADIISATDLQTERSSVSIRDLVRAESIQVRDVSAKHLELITGGSGLILDEILRADLNSDGREEILVAYSEYAIGGTFGASGVLVLKRHNETDLVEVDKETMTKWFQRLCA